ncbi:glycosyltransferase family 1 protein [Haloarcula sp. CBA1130]|uniref:glycosyltransferase family 4 protein n=1 Tax=unclassified Haloarcula TaxID=2624677 RepID=UPI0012450DD1|nr:MULTISPECIES: glycosyltransferase family 4 protein [unclassified Haloarcula]KAA9397854.1 glycosyltransferase family 1 protein [Haloarcula sp. CBA1129]KAA9402458.1 glycosyltransferase family 1 protein [Haloarcula sp. CBA1130]
MNVCFISNVIYPFVTGGAEKRIHEIGTRLAADGHDVTVYGRHFWDGPKEITHEGMTLRAVSPNRELYTDDDGRRSIGEALEFAKDVVIPLRRHIDEHDVVVASVFPYFPVLASKLAALDTDTPLVTTWHEVWGDYWDGYLGHLAPFGKGVEHVTARVPQHPIAVSELTAGRLGGIGPERDQIRTVPNGIDYEQIRDTPPVEDGFDVLFAGRLIEDKRVDVLLRAFDQVAPEETTLGIVGDGPKRTELETLADSLSVAEQITFTGFLEEYDDVLAQMQTARIFATPSTREGFGITAVEAMAAGCTVIGADHPDSAVGEVIGNAGFLADPTVDGVADVLDRVLAGAEPTTKPRQRAQRFDWDQVAEDALDAYTAAAAGEW